MRTTATYRFVMPMKVYGGTGGRSLSRNQWVAGSNPYSVHCGHCVLGRVTTPILPAGVDHRAGWSLYMAASLLSVCLRATVPIM